VKLKQLAQIVSLICIAGPALAQTPAPTVSPSAPAPAAKPPAAKTEKIEVTGSNIKRVQDEGALPIQIISREDIERAGITSAEQLVATISANGNGTDNLSSNMGVINNSPEFRNNFGNASANLRGLGASSTLVLLNGRRVSTHGAKGNAVDLSTIPLAAIQRVEVLKDGASAIYGTDAIGGVINFIMRKDYKGVELTAFSDMTEGGGGNVYRGNVLMGWGELGKDRFNVMANLTWDKQEKLRAEDRRSFVNGFQPERGLSPDTTGTPFATVGTGAGSALPGSFTTPNLGTGATLFNRANLLSFQGRCDSVPQMTQYQFVLWDTPSFRYGCAYDYVGQQTLIQPLSRYNAVGRATFELTPTNTLIAEFVGNKTNATRAFEESQVVTSVAAGNAYPVTGSAYATVANALRSFIPTFDNTRPLAYRWRCLECGKRTIETDTQAYRGLLAMEGQVGKFDYKVGVSTAKSKADSVLLDGYMRATDFNTLLASGLVNPFLFPGQTQTPAAMAAIEAAKAKGTKLFGGEATLKQVDGSISGEVYNLPAGAIAAAAGFDFREESYKFSDGAPSGPAGGVRDAPFDAEFPKVSRKIRAYYAEAIVPLLKNLELTAAVRRDKYSDFGTTTNPKASLKFTASENVLFRGSYSEGFRAPSFFQLYTATSESPIPGNIADPVLCPQNPGNPTFCAIRPNGRSGGNPTLQPETSKQWTVGFVLVPTTWLTTSVDLWQIRRKDIIYSLTPQTVVANFTTFPENLVRGATGRLDEPGGYIRAGYVNADGDILRGLEFSAEAKTKLGNGRLTTSFNGTYLDSVKTRVFITQPYTNLVGIQDPNFTTLYIRWKHNISATYSTGPWNFTLTQNFTGRYNDQRPFTPPPGWDSEVKAYVTHNFSTSYTGFKNTTLRFGIKNIANTKPSFTAHNVDFLPGAGWDARVGDPRLRAYTMSATYKF
jgi:iron complex outermembrane receptor protein